MMINDKNFSWTLQKSNTCSELCAINVMINDERQRRRISVGRRELWQVLSIFAGGQNLGANLSAKKLAPELDRSIDSGCAPELGGPINEDGNRQSGPVLFLNLEEQLEEQQH